MEKTIYKRSVELHEASGGKISTKVNVPLETQDDLSLAYTPGVAEPCRVIERNPERAYDLTWKGRVVAVVTDGSAVLGLGNLTPEAALPVMEGKSALIKKFAGIDSIPICLDTKDPDEIINAVKLIAPTFGGINLEDIAAPKCIKVERELVEALDIPVFHDDQHGTAIVVGAALINAAKFVCKELSKMTVVVSGTGAAGSAIIKMLHNLGVGKIYGFNINGILRRGESHEDFLVEELSQITNSENHDWTMAEAMKEADAFIGVSKGGIVTQDMVASMKRDPIVFAMANPDPEITYDEGMRAGALVMGTGRSDYPNQINNVLAFPGIWLGVMECRATKITEEMKMAAVYALASLVSDAELHGGYIIPKPSDERVVKAVAEAVVAKAREQGVART
ncbi:MAG: NADP-dependent malic enzyme [Clostridia bacterium]|nr:NADP-dependent malic enzyme [Clostridia bacterium]